MFGLNNFYIGFAGVFLSVVSTISILYSDMQMQSRRFVYETSVELAPKIDEDRERMVASIRIKDLTSHNISSKNALQIRSQILKELSPTNHSDCPVTAKQINGMWETQLLKTARNNNPNGKKIFVRKVFLELKDSCQVVINNRPDKFVYQISGLEDDKLLSIFKEDPKSHLKEILNLVRLPESRPSDRFRKESKMASNKLSAPGEDTPKGQEVEQQIREFELRSARINRKDGTEIFKPTQMSGSMVFGYDDDFSINVSLTSKEKKNGSISFSYETTRTGNAIIIPADEDGSGGVNNVAVLNDSSGGHIYTVSFSTGQFAGLTLEFVSADEIERVATFEQENGSRVDEVVDQDIYNEESPVETGEDQAQNSTYSEVQDELEKKVEDQIQVAMVSGFKF